MTNALQTIQLGLFKRTSLALGIITLALLGSGRAQEVDIANLKLSSTTIKANNEALSLPSQTPVAAFSNTEMLCPATHAKGCSIRIVVSCQFSNVFINAPGGALQLSISTTSRLGVYPASLVNVYTWSGAAQLRFNGWSWVSRQA
jgi:hypothetical protein